MRIITIKLYNPKDWDIVSHLLKYLKIKFEWSEEKTSEPSEEPGHDAIAELYGSWDSDLSGDELAQSIREARVNQSLELL